MPHSPAVPSEQPEHVPPSPRASMYTPIIGTLGYVLSPDRERVLMVRRSRDGDLHQGKYNGLGGKLEPGEDVVACLVRELREEADIEYAVVHIARFHEGKIVELWDIVQQIPAGSPNKLGMF